MLRPVRPNSTYIGTVTVNTSPALINLKLFVNSKARVNQDPIIPIWHRWIKDKVLDEVLIDVADYRHVHQGPGVMLIAHDANYCLDEAEDHTGLLYSAKRSVTGSLTEQLRRAFDKTLKAAELLEQATAGSRALIFSASPLLLRVHSRIVTGTTADERGAFQLDLESALGTLFPQQRVLSRSAGSEREPLGVLLTLDPAAQDVRGLRAQANL